MPANWTTPKTWNTGDPLIASDMNTHIRDNMEWLKAGNTQGVIGNGSDLTTTSTSFVEIDASGHTTTISLTCNGGTVVATLSGEIVGSGSINISFNVTVDGAAAFADDGIMTQGATTTDDTIFFRVPVGAPAAGAHTFVFQWKVSAGTGTFRNGGGASVGRDTHPVFSVAEVAA